MLTAFEAQYDASKNAYGVYREVLRVFAFEPQDLVFPCLLVGHYSRWARSRGVRALFHHLVEVYQTLE